MDWFKAGWQNNPAGVAGYFASQQPVTPAPRNRIAPTPVSTNVAKPFPVTGGPAPALPKPSVFANNSINNAGSAFSNPWWSAQNIYKEPQWTSPFGFPSVEDGFYADPSGRKTFSGKLLPYFAKNMFQPGINLSSPEASPDGESSEEGTAAILNWDMPFSGKPLYEWAAMDPSKVDFAALDPDLAKLPADIQQAIRDDWDNYLLGQAGGLNLGGPSGRGDLFEYIPDGYSPVTVGKHGDPLRTHGEYSWRSLNGAQYVPGVGLVLPSKNYRAGDTTFMDKLAPALILGAAGMGIGQMISAGAGGFMPAASSAFDSTALYSGGAGGGAVGGAVGGGAGGGGGFFTGESGLASLPQAGTWAHTAIPAAGAGAGQWTLPAALAELSSASTYGAGAGVLGEALQALGNSMPVVAGEGITTAGAPLTSFEQLINTIKGVGNPLSKLSDANTVFKGISSLTGGNGGGTMAGGTTTVQNFSPTETAARNKGLQEAMGLYDVLKTNPIPFGKAAPVAQSPTTLAAMDALTGYANTLQGQIGDLQSKMQYGLNAMDVANNPYVRDAIAAAQRRLSEQFTDAGGVLSNIRNNAAVNGQVGSSRQGVAEGIATGRLANASGDIATQMYMDAFGKGQDLYAKTMAMAPSLLQLGAIPGTVLANVGESQDKYAQSVADYGAEKTNYEASQPLALLQDYLRMISGMGSSQSTSSIPRSEPSTIQKLIGGASLGGSMADLFNVSSGTGAGVGALLSYFL